MKRGMSFRISCLLLTTVLALTYGVAFAHGTTSVGDYELEMGFHDEPVIQGEPNSLDLFVTDTKTNEKVNGLEGTLQAELIFGASKKTLKIQPQEGQDGAYTAYVIPTEIGDYTWHIFGKIGDTPVDTSMTASPTTFGSVESKADYSFPAAEPGVAQLSDQAAAAAQSAQTALMAGIAGVILGLAALVISIVPRQGRQPAGKAVPETAHPAP